VDYGSGKTVTYRVRVNLRKYDALNAVAFAISSPGVVVAVFAHGTARSVGMFVWMTGVALGVIVNIVALFTQRRARRAEEAAFDAEPVVAVADDEDVPVAV
jgi:membrane protein DedA with SNARE-associated domain